jgi:hypothetical protein
MEVGGAAAAPQHEIDAVRWIPLEAAARELSYPRDRDLVGSFTRQLAALAMDRP